MKKEGKSTSSMRNQARRRRALEAESSSSDNLFHCCGIALPWVADDEDDGAVADAVAKREQDKAKYNAKVKAREQYESQLIAQFGKARAARQLQSADTSGEVYEMVDLDDEVEAEKVRSGYKLKSESKPTVKV
jgi:hypothetical protein